MTKRKKIFAVTIVLLCLVVWFEGRRVPFAFQCLEAETALLENFNS